MTALALFFSTFHRCAALLAAAVMCLGAWASADWPEVQDTDLRIVAGSPLDVDSWEGIASIADARDPDRKRPPYNCASLAWSPATGGFPDHAEATQYARQLKAHGYNLVRFHYVEATLMARRDDDFDFDREQLDNWYFFLAELKKNGISWVFDALSSENGAIGAVYPHRWVKKHNLKARLYTDENTQKHWRDLTTRMLTAVNPYTKARPVDDPSLLGVILVNESPIDYLAVTAKVWPPGLERAFNNWLADQYKDRTKLKQSWLSDLDSARELIDHPIQLPESPWSRSAKATDAQRFITQIETKTGQWMSEHIRRMGFKGWITSYDNWPALATSVSRSAFSWVDMHNYHEELNGWNPGAVIKQTSSIDDGVKYAQVLATARQKGRKYSVTEYGQPFWNQYRYETGITVPAMARLQGWDFICLHSMGAIDLTTTQTAPFKRQIMPYGVGLDPAARAAETLSTAIQLFNDVKPAPQTITLNVTPDEAWRAGSFGVVPESLNYLSWLTGVQLDVSDSKKLGNDGYFESITSRTRAVDINTYIDRLRRSGVLPRSNRTDVEKGVFESATGQILMNTKRGTFVVNTPRIKALASKAGQAPIEIDALTIKTMSDSGLVALIALDNQTVESSRRILIVAVSDAGNSDMKFGDTERRQLLRLGTLPATIKPFQARLDLISKLSGKKPKLTSLNLNGTTGSSLESRQEGNHVMLEVNSAPPNGRPTTFFLLTFAD